MRDAIGGTVVLVIIVAFIVIVLSYMAFNVNYTKAFRMKDKIISIYDDYNGNCEAACHKEISDYAKKIGYYVVNLKCPDHFNPYDKYYCYQRVPIKAPDSDPTKTYSVGESEYYRIVTKINLDVPVINNILDLDYFYIYGDTKIYSNFDK